MQAASSTASRQAEGLIDVLERGDIDALDLPDEELELVGNAAHEIRRWLGVAGAGSSASGASPGSPAEQKKSGAQFARVADCGDAGAGEPLKAIAGR